MAKHRLTFRQVDLEVTLAGMKTATLRFSKHAERVKEGDALMLAFGAHHKPTVLEAVAVRVLSFDLEEPILAFGEKLERDPDVIIEPSLDFADPEFLEALGASYGVLTDVLCEAVERKLYTVTAIFWKLVALEQKAA